MSGYIQQDLFNQCAIATAFMSVVEKTSPEVVVSEVLAIYESSYNDNNLREEVVLAAKQISGYCKRSVPSESLRDMLLLMYYCAVNYEPSGRKKRKKLFGGTLFNKETYPLDGKVKKCIENIMTYDMHIQNGTIKYDGKWMP